MVSWEIYCDQEWPHEDKHVDFGDFIFWLRDTKGIEALGCYSDLDYLQGDMFGVRGVFVFRPRIPTCSRDLVALGKLYVTGIQTGRQAYSWDNRYIQRRNLNMGQVWGVWSLYNLTQKHHRWWSTWVRSSIYWDPESWQTSTWFGGVWTFEPGISTDRQACVWVSLYVLTRNPDRQTGMWFSDSVFSDPESSQIDVHGTWEISTFWPWIPTSGPHTAWFMIARGPRKMWSQWDY